MKSFLLPVIAGLLIIGFWISSDFQVISAGVAIFLFGMLMLEDGFRQYSGGVLERLLTAATSSIPRSLAFGIVSTTAMQSSSLVSVITISFLSAGLIPLIAGVGIIFGANIGTTTGAWLVAGFGLKVKISAYAMPLLALGAVLAFQRSKHIRGAGLVLAGLGFLFLGIHYMKEGFDTFKDQFDLTRLALSGIIGLIVYTLVGALATVVMQSSHATMVLVITALAAGQIAYENALALAIGANIGTTITAIIGSLSSNYQGKRLALAHVIFNVTTAVVALIFISPLRDIVEFVSSSVGIADDDYALKLAVFHTIFNVLGVAIMLPFLRKLISFLVRTIKETALDRSQPRYLHEAVDAFPETVRVALEKETRHLYENAVELITHGLNLHRHKLFAAEDVAAMVRTSREPFDFDLDATYENRVKTLHSAIIEFTTRIGSKDLPPKTMRRVFELRDAAGLIVRSVKAIKHLRRNTSRYTSYPQGAVTEIYNDLRIELARILVQIRAMDQADPEERSSLWMEEELVQIEQGQRDRSRKVEELLSKGELSPEAATSFLNDSGYAYDAMRDLVGAARGYYVEKNTAVADVERIISMDDEDVEEILTEDSAPKPERKSEL
jgi:phosphate:Na+ symporter